MPLKRPVYKTKVLTQCTESSIEGKGTLCYRIKNFRVPCAYFNSIELLFPSNVVWIKCNRQILTGRNKEAEGYKRDHFEKAFLWSHTHSRI